MTYVEEQTLYDILGVEEDASNERIRHAFKEKALLLHPDRHMGPGGTGQSHHDNNNKSSTSTAEVSLPSPTRAAVRREANAETFKAVANAYDTLKDPVKRADYDAELRRRRAGSQSMGVMAANPMDFFGGSGMRDIFFGRNVHEDLRTHAKEFHHRDARTGVEEHGFFYDSRNDPDFDPSKGAYTCYSFSTTSSPQGMRFAPRGHEARFSSRQPARGPIVEEPDDDVPPRHYAAQPHPSRRPGGSQRRVHDPFAHMSDPFMHDPFADMRAMMDSFSTMHSFFHQPRSRQDRGMGGFDSFF